MATINPLKASIWDTGDCAEMWLSFVRNQEKLYTEALAKLIGCGDLTDFHG